MSELEVNININNEQIAAEVADLSVQTDTLAIKWRSIKMIIMAESKHILMAVGGIILMVKGVIDSLGFTLGTFGDLVVNVAMTVVQAIVGMYLAYTAAGPHGWIFVAFGLVALEFAIANHYVVAMRNEANKAQLQGIRTAISGLQSALRPWG